MKQHELLILIEKYLDGTATNAEKELLEQYYNSFQQKDQWPEKDLGNASDTEKAILQHLQKAINREQGSRVVSFFKRNAVRMVAALFLLAVGSLGWWMLSKEEWTQTAQKEAIQGAQIAHKHNTTLTLADGTVMVLDSLADGVLLTAETTIIRKQGSKVIIDPVKSPTGKAPDTGLYTLKTPVGRQYEALLADGSLVWLNAASSLRFPVVFDSSERSVHLVGEAFFDVAKELDRPFKVLTINDTVQNGSLIEVLGTQFNVNAYNDEQTLKTTLVEGSVKVAPIAAFSHPSVNVASVLSPGQQAEVPKEETNLPVRVKDVDVTEVVAWKDNLFNFNNTDLPGIMRQLARWYDVEVVYAGNVPVRHFSGKINRSLPISTVLEILEQSNIRFKIKGKQILVKS